MRPFGIFTRLASAIVAPALLIAACGGGAGGPPATFIDVSPGFLAFDGTSEATLTVTADGVWTVSSDSNWLRTNRTSGQSGTSTLTVTVNRGGLAVGSYAGALTFRGSSPISAVNVGMRFPRVTGVITDSDGRIGVGSVGDPTLLERAASASAADLAREEIIPGEYIVMLNAEVARALEAGVSGMIAPELVASAATYHSMTAGLAADYGFTIAAQLVSADFPMLVVRSGSGLDLAAMARDGRVASVEPNLRWTLPKPQGDYRLAAYDFGLQWHYEDINLEEAWDVTEGTSSVVVAVIDGGFALGHGDLVGNLLPGYDFAGNDSNPGLNPGNNMACAGHGTHVAGTVAATWNATYNVVGVAPDVRIRPVRIGSEAGADGCTLTTARIVNAILWSAGQSVGAAPVLPAVDVINLSLGGYGETPALEAAVAAALAAGVSVVAAAGNDATATVANPAAYDGVIGVSATNYLEQLAYYSNVGQEIDVAAPGGDIRYDRNDDGYFDGVLSLAWDPATSSQYYQFMQGTSMASPHVAGVVALMKSVNPSLTPAQVVSVLRNTARDIGIAGPDTFYGWGMVDAGAAVEMASAGVFSQVEVRLLSGDTIVASGMASPSGTFDLGQVSAGSYTIRAGTDKDGDGAINDPGEYFGSVPVTVSYSGDAYRAVDVNPR